MTWPQSAAELIADQGRLGALSPPPWRPPRGFAAGGCFICFGRGGAGAGYAGDRGWAAATVQSQGRWITRVVAGSAGAPYEAGLLALREGSLLEDAVTALPVRPDVLLVNATGRDHPRRAGLALHLGQVLAIPSVGVTHRPLQAAGEWPADERGAFSPLILQGEVVGAWLRTRPGTRPLAVHAAWRTDVATAVEVVMAACGAQRTPAPLRVAREAARKARAASTPIDLPSPTQWERGRG